MVAASDGFRDFLDRMPDGFLCGRLVWRDGEPVDCIVLQANEALARIAGLPRSELIGRRVTEIVPRHKEMGSEWLAPYARTALRGQPVVVDRYSHSSGHWFELTVYREDEDTINVLFHDITEHKKTGEALRRSERRYRALFEDSVDAIFVVRPDGSGIEANQAWLDMFGYSSEDLVDARAPDLYADPAERDVFLQRIARHGRVQDVVRLRRRDGSVFVCERSVVALRDDTGQVVLFQGVHRDITRRMKAEQALRASEAAAKALLDATPDAACLIDLDGTILSINEEMARRMHTTPDRALGRRAWEMLPAEVISGRMARLEEVVRSGKSVRFEDVREGRLILSSLSPVLDAAGRVIRLAVYGRDITDERHVEQELRDSREELRSLAAREQQVREQERIGIARELHDEMGQQLTVLKMGLHWVRKQLVSGQPVGDGDFTPMLDAVERMGEDVRRISSELRPGVLDDFGLVAAMEWQMSQYQARTGIEFELDSSVDDSSLNKELATALFRVFQELLTNVARHAEARHVRAGLTAMEGRYVLTVSDDGRGITPSQVSSHTSLGLIGMRERLRPYGGSLEFDRPASGGTVARVVVPGPLTSAEQ
jgi:PAS domain S-box-containing protein